MSLLQTGASKIEDIVDSFALAGVQLSWLRERAGEIGHHVVLWPEDGSAPVRHGPFTRKQARMVFEAMQATLLAAARQQHAQLLKIVGRLRTSR
jgi:hypothetical protein